MLLLTSHPTLDFYSTAAVVLPVLFLAVLVEMRLSAAAPPLEEEESENWLVFRVLAFVVALESMVFGEASSFEALWRGVGSRVDGVVTAVALGLLGLVLLKPLAERLNLDIDAGGKERAKRVRLRVRLAGAVGLVVVLVLFSGGCSALTRRTGQRGVTGSGMNRR